MLGEGGRSGWRRRRVRSGTVPTAATGDRRLPFVGRRAELRRLEIKLRDAFLELDWGNPAHDKILRDINARSFLPADYQDFELLENVAASLGLMGGAS